MKEDKAEIRDGSEWADHEDCIVGNEEGIRNLKAACEKAIENGEYFGSDLGDYVGVKVLDASWFKKPEDSRSSRYANTILATVLFIAFCLMVVGLISVIKWFF